MILCVYCRKNEAGNSEHVFPKALGGADVYLDCVCDSCNNFFSGFERDFIQKSPIGLIRSDKQVRGYKSAKHRKNTLKFDEIFSYDEKSGIVLEAGTESGFKSYLRPQIHFQDNLFASVGSSKAELEDFYRLLNLWVHASRKVAISFPKAKGEPYQCIKFDVEDETVLVTNFTESRINDKIYLIHRNVSNVSSHSAYFEPRIFLDDNLRLIIRSRSAKESINFLSEFFKRIIETKKLKITALNVGSTDKVNTSMVFSHVSFLRATLKIGLNALFYYYPQSREAKSLDPFKDFILMDENIPPIKGELFSRLFEFDKTHENCHSIIFSQTRDGLGIRVSFFGSLVNFFVVPELYLENSSLLLINYNERRMSILPL